MNKKLIIGLIGAVAIGGYLYLSGGLGAKERNLTASTIKNLDYENNSKECEVVSSTYFKEFYQYLGKTEISLGIGFGGRDLTRVVYWGMPETGTFLLSDGILLASNSTKEVILLDKDLVAKAPEKFKKVCFTDFKPDDENKDNILKNLSNKNPANIDREIIFTDAEKNQDRLKRMGFNDAKGTTATGQAIGAFILQSIAK